LPSRLAIRKDHRVGRLAEARCSGGDRTAEARLYELPVNRGRDGTSEPSTEFCGCVVLIL
jgi:hypothetical protein